MDRVYTLSFFFYRALLYVILYEIIGYVPVDCGKISEHRIRSWQDGSPCSGVQATPRKALSPRAEGAMQVIFKKIPQLNITEPNYKIS